MVLTWHGFRWYCIWAILTYIFMLIGSIIGGKLAHPHNHPMGMGCKIRKIAGKFNLGSVLSHNIACESYWSPSVCLLKSWSEPDVLGDMLTQLNQLLIKKKLAGMLSSGITCGFDINLHALNETKLQAICLLILNLMRCVKSHMALIKFVTNMKMKVNVSWFNRNIWNVKWIYKNTMREFMFYMLLEAFTWCPSIVHVSCMRMLMFEVVIMISWYVYKVINCLK